MQSPKVSKARALLMELVESKLDDAFLSTETRFVSLDSVSKEISREFGLLAAEVFNKFAANQQLTENEMVQYKGLLSQFFMRRIEKVKNEGAIDYTSQACLKQLEELK